MGYSMRKKCKKLYNYIWDEDTKELLIHWLKLMVSAKGIWFFVPALLGILATYWFMYHGYYDTEATIKPAMEMISVEIIGFAAAIFLVRVICYRMKLDILMLLLTLGFFCREIHFKGSDEGVIVILVLVLILILKWKNEILDSLNGADCFLIVFGSLLFTYILAFLVQRGVFGHIPILPDEEAVSEGLEEVLENIGHIMFIVLGIVSFFSLNINRKKEIK
jgi:hypothetical protein